MKAVHLSRRGFLLGAGGLAGLLTLGVSRASAAAERFTPNLFIELHPDGRLRIVCHRSEMGQGVRSSIPALIGVEMGASLERIEVVQADGDPRYGDQNTDGSSSIRQRYPQLRAMGAVARQLLITAAAARWGVDAAGLTTLDHAVHDGAGNQLSFGELALQAAALPVPNPDTVPLRDDASPVGTDDLPLVDAPDIVTGRAGYGADVQLEGMWVAVIARPPAPGDTPLLHDDSAARAVPGVQEVLTLPLARWPGGFAPLGGVAVLATDTWSAMQGRKALELSWQDGPNGSFDSARWESQLAASLSSSGTPRRVVADADKALGRAKRRVLADYRVPLLIHAPMEPPVALARPTEDGVEIWACTQTPQAVQRQVAATLGLEPAEVVVHVTLLGAGFGRKSKPDFAVEAAWLAMQVGRPVRVQWTREDEIRHGYYHAASWQRLEAGIDRKGHVTAWRHRIASPSISATFRRGVDEISGELDQGITDLPLAVPAISVETLPAPAHLRIGWMRSVYNINHAFAVQSFIAELAEALERPHVEVLGEVLGAPRSLDPAGQGVEAIGNYGAPLAEHPLEVARWHDVVDRVAVNARLDQPSAGVGLGLAVHHSFLTTVATVVAVSDAGGEPQIEEVWVVCDPGRVVNRERVRAQLEGAVIFGLSLALYGEITVAGGAVVQSNFHDFPVLRLAEAPRAIHIELVCERDVPGGIGEPGVPPVAPALANAWAALTGERVRQLPFRKRVSGGGR